MTPETRIYNVRAEEELLGMAAVWPEQALAKLASVPEPWFSQAHTRAARAALLELHDQGRGDVPAVELMRLIAKHADGDAETLRLAVRALGHPSSPTHWGFWAAQLRDSYKRLQVVRKANEVTEGGAIADMDALHRDLEEMAAITMPPDTRPVESLSGVLGAVVDEMQAAVDAVRSGGTNLRGIPIGIAQIDALTGGFVAGQLIVVGARPGAGKTALICSAAYAAALAGRRVLIFSFEMSREEIARRLLSIHTGVPASAMTQGKISHRQQIAIAEQMEDVARLPIQIAERADATLGSVRLEIDRAFQSDFPPDVVCIDYLQLMRCPPKKGERKERREQVDEISRSLKLWAREFNVPIICAAQLNRDAANKEPTLSEFRESGAIEQDADIAILLHRPEATDDDPDEDAKLIVAKHRNGPTGHVSATYRRRLMHWITRESRSDDW